MHMIGADEAPPLPKRVPIVCIPPEGTTIDAIKRSACVEALKRTRGQKVVAARLLKIEYKTVLRYVKKFNIDVTRIFDDPGPRLVRFRKAVLPMLAIERHALIVALKRAKWVQSDAGALLGLTSRAMHYKIHDAHDLPLSKRHRKWRRNRKKRA